MGPATIIEADPEVVSCALGDGTALLDLRTGTYFALNSVGAFVWEQLAAPASLSDIQRLVMDRFEVGEAQCAADLIALVEALDGAHLVRVR
jgi:hypothetical protein